MVVGHAWSPISIQRWPHPNPPHYPPLSSSGKGATADAPSSGQQLEAAFEDWSTEDLDHVVLRELEGVSDERGRPLRIVYRNGAVVDAVALEELCDKV